MSGIFISLPTFVTQQYDDFFKTYAWSRVQSVVFLLKHDIEFLLHNKYTFDAEVVTTRRKSVNLHIYYPHLLHNNMMISSKLMLGPVSSQLYFF